MQFTAHGAAERFVDELMLLELGFAGEFGRNDDCPHSGCCRRQGR